MTSPTSTATMNYEEIISSIGGCGPYQLILMIALAFTCMQAGMDLESNIYMHYTPKFHCIEERFLQLVNSSTYQKVDECKATLFMNASRTNSITIGSHNQTGEIIKCTSWGYDTSVMRSTFVTEYNLVCDHAYMTTLIESLYFSGIAIGMILGTIGDTIGRRKMILACATWEVLINLCIPLIHNFHILVALRFMRGFSQSIYYQGLALISEILPIKYRARYGTNYWLFWGLGYITIPGIAYLTREWRPMKLYSTITQVAYISYIFIVPESPRWLSSIGKSKEANQELKKIARWNGCKSIATLEDNETLKEGQHPDSILQAFQQPNMRIKTLSFWMILSSVAIGYYGLSMDENFASEDIFLNVFWQGIIEFPTGPLGWILCDKVGRRSPLSIVLVLASVAILCTPFLRFLGISWLTTIVAILGKFLLTTAYQIADMYVVEIFPTTLRNTGVFTACMWAQITTTIAPFINRISDHVFFGSALIFSIMLFISSLLTWFLLPETKDCPLAQTVEEAEKFVRGHEKEWSKAYLTKKSTVGENECLLNHLAADSKPIEVDDEVSLPPIAMMTYLTAPEGDDLNSPGESKLL